MAPPTDRQVALLSIHPEYANAILDGGKRVEFRKTPLREGTTHVIVYSTSPVQRVVGTFAVDGVDRDHPDELWDKYADVGGITADDFFSYYRGKAVGYAIGVESPRRLKPALELEDVIPGGHPPQNVMYLEPTRLPEPPPSQARLVPSVTTAISSLFHKAYSFIAGNGNRSQ